MLSEGASQQLESSWRNRTKSTYGSKVEIAGVRNGVDISLGVL